MNTKNISWLGLGLFAAVALASCDNIEDSLSQPITNPQEPIYNSATIVYNAVSAINASNPEGEVQVATYTAEGLPEGYALGGTLELSPYEDFSKMISAPLTVSDGALYASLADIAAQYTDGFTKNPAVVTLYGRTILTAANGTDKVRLGTLDTFYGVGTYTFTPAAPDHEIAPAYYVVMGDGSNWDYTDAIKMDHQGANQYDDPVFTVVVRSVSSVGDKWILLSEEGLDKAKASGLSGVEALVPVADGDGGDFEKVTTGSFTGLTAIGAPCEITFNAQRMTYSSKAAVETYYATGDGWSNWSTHWMPLSTTNYTEYYGFLNLDSAFKFAPQAAWGGDFGSSDPLDESENGGVFNYSGVLNRASDNITIAHPGLYWACLNAATWELSLQGIASWGLIGDFNGWGGDIEMTPSEDLFTWTAELTVEAGQGWKFRANSDWAINLGGQPDALWNNGDNITLDAGTYTITLDLTTYPAKYTAVKK
ncbi:MAG: hypothetical protein K2L11_01340 [Muribaculaceae bacterium]|nr:hypothetical protein [Muribaculaceae bacterium]